MNRFIALVKKESLVLSKDIHGLIALFFMPALFILIMSLALQNAFEEEEDLVIEYIVADLSANEASAELIRRLKTNKTFKPRLLEGENNNMETLQKAIREQHYELGLVIPVDYPRTLEPTGSAEAVLRLYKSPEIKPYLTQLFSNFIYSEITKQKLSLFLSKSQKESKISKLLEENDDRFLQQQYVYSAGESMASRDPVPTSVQQNVPAWLIFAMFFVVIPISTAFLVEKQNGTLLRLRVMNVRPSLLLLGKLIPYYIVNQIQMVFMIAIGIYVVPMLGGDKLNWVSSLTGLVIISSAASVAAIGFALLIAAIARTTVIATTVGGIFNLIFGALGGIMVPKFVMPPVMQNLTVLSPMAWGLDGFLDMFLRNAGWTSVLPETASLFAFGFVCLVAATVVFSKTTEIGSGMQ